MVAWSVFGHCCLGSARVAVVASRLSSRRAITGKAGVGFILVAPHMRHIEPLHPVNCNDSESVAWRVKLLSSERQPSRVQARAAKHSR